MLDDNRIREMMLDAEEKVPSRVWSAVSSRLDEQSGRKAAPVWKWCCAGVAFAAAAALALFLTLPGTGDRKNEINETAATAELLLPDRQVASEKQTVAERKLAPEKQAATEKQLAPEKQVVPEKQAAPERQAAPEKQSAPEKQLAPEKQAAAETQVVPEKQAAAEQEDNTVEIRESADLLARMEYEDTYKTSGKGQDITFGGALSGNTATRMTISRMSPGAGSVPTSDVISERSVSEFGVPFTLGVGMRWYVLPKFAIGTGLDYSLLTRTFAGTFTAAGSTTSVQGDVRNYLHYIGIPVNLYYDIINTSAVDFYVYGGGEGEYCVNNKFIFQPAGAEKFSVTQKVSGLQFSAKLGFGVQFYLTKRVGLYLDPGVSYYFYNSQPKSIRTERPFMFNFNAGLRFDLRK